MNLFDTRPYEQRRQRVLDWMQTLGGGIAVLSMAPEIVRNRDSHYPYRHDSYFYYLTGFTEPDAMLVLIAGEKNQSILFCRPKDELAELWEGYRFGPDQACETFGLDAAYAMTELNTRMPELMADHLNLFYPLTDNHGVAARVTTWLDEIKRQSRKGVRSPAGIYDITQLLDEMRLFKDANELAVMRRAARISAQGHIRAMTTCVAGMPEYALEAELCYEFRRHGAQGVAYSSIVASGANACVLHYRANDSILTQGDLVLIDAACELDGYAADITRTFPVGGRFSGVQRNLYQIVLDAQLAAIEACRPGNTFDDPHQAALRVIAQGLLDEKLLTGSVDEVLETSSYRKFYMHRTSHWLGMDVHDCGEYRDVPIGSQERPWRTLAPGMVLTVEPGLYIHPSDDVPEDYWNIGIRIEDDVLITERSHDVLSRDAPKHIGEIEALRLAMVDFTEHLSDE
jgi:Xaa-Pro aminopeptidase